MIVSRELESVTVNEGDVVIDDVGSALPCTMNTILAKFNVSEANPIPFVNAKPEEPVEQEAPVEPETPAKPVKKTSKKAKKAEPEEDDF